MFSRAFVRQQFLRSLLSNGTISSAQRCKPASDSLLTLSWTSRRHICTTVSVCSDHRRTPSQASADVQEKGDNKSEELTHENVPLIVKLVRERHKQGGPMSDSSGEPPQKMSVEMLQKTLEDINWDARASIRRANIDSLEREEEESTGENVDQTEEDFPQDSVPEMHFIEDIYLDNEVPSVRTLNPKARSKPRMKGTPDPSIPKSGVPCSGCGAELHCQDPIIPGYMPSEKFTCLTKEDMRTSVCLRCFLIQTHNMFLNVRVSAETYPQILHEIRCTRALVVVVVDLFDMRNSVFRDLLKCIGMNRPLFVVGNKVDLLPEDQPGYLKRTEKALYKVCESMGLNPTGKNIKHLCLVSAKTGYGIEHLITKLMIEWGQKGHVYVVGSTNVGKSTLFNALLMSDYCKSVARGSINRATVSVWPGTTLNLLKFPIINPSKWRVALRAKRLQKDSEDWVKEEALRRVRLEGVGSYKSALLTGHVGLTDFRGPKKIQEEMGRMSEGQDILSFVENKQGLLTEVSGRESLPPQPKEMAYKPDGFPMYWCNDTPGVVNPEQIINLLEPEELIAVLPKSLIQPQCVVVKPGQVLFVTGMGRLDYVKGSGNKSIYLTVHACYGVPLHVKDSHEADTFYQEALGTSTLAIPIGDKDRLEKVPALVGREFHLTGASWDLAVADIQLSSLGWVSVSAGSGMEVTLRAYTPGARGLYVRSPALMPYYTYFRGKRRGKTPFYRPVKPKIK